MMRVHFVRLLLLVACLAAGVAAWAAAPLSTQAPRYPLVLLSHGSTSVNLKEP